MMGARQVLLVCATVFMCALGARADVAPALSETTLPLAKSVVLPESFQANLPVAPRQQFDEINWLLEGVAPNSALPALSRVVPPAFRDQSETPVLREVPPVQNSAALALCALVTLGAYEGGRSLRRLYAAGALPEWYHEGAVQIGHSTPLDLEFSLSALPLCRFDSPANVGGDQALPTWQWQREPRHPLPSQSTVLIADPRGPPPHCF